jgi:hypothetical protein
LDLPRFTTVLPLALTPEARFGVFLVPLALRWSNHNITHATARDNKQSLLLSSVDKIISEGNVVPKIPNATPVIADLIKLELINTSMVKLI